MAAIDLIVLGILKKESLSAYDIQKLVEYRNISKWVKISTPSIYKKVIQLEEKKLVKSNIVKEGKMPEKAVYSLTEAGEREFERLMLDISTKPVHFFFGFQRCHRKPVKPLSRSAETMSDRYRQQCEDLKIIYRGEPDY